MSPIKDALSPLHPPAPTAPPVVDATIDAEHDPRRGAFEKIKHMPAPEQYGALMALIDEFIAAGHNPRNPSDIMFEILGISPDFLEAMLFAMKEHVPVKTLSPDPIPEQSNAPQQAANDPLAEDIPSPATQIVS